MVLVRAMEVARVVQMAVGLPAVVREVELVQVVVAVWVVVLLQVVVAVLALPSKGVACWLGTCPSHYRSPQ